MGSGSSWRIWIDTGGTFTDCLAVDPDGLLRRCKVLSSGALRDRIESILDDGDVVLRDTARLPRDFLAGFKLSRVGGEAELEVLHHDASRGTVRLAESAPWLRPGTAVELHSGEEAPLLAARLITGTARRSGLPPVVMRLATTRGTNALLERRGARSAHVTTAGFEDLLRIGDQRRPLLFALAIERSAPLPEVMVGVRQRMSATGEVLEKLETDELFDEAARLVESGIRCASVTLLHGHRNPEHELQVEQVLRSAGFEYVARSSALSPFQGLLRRSQTCAADAYLGPVIDDYLRAVDSGLGRRRRSLHVMTSAGGLVSADRYRPMDSLLSGPAGGVVGAATAGRRFGADRVIAFDMGGTSTDVSRFDGDFEYVFAHRVGPVELATPALAIETVAAGGGSVCHVDQGRLAVGPHSAGASPGPASYGAGGPLSLTDVNLLLGRLVPERFPIPLEPDAARARFEELKGELGDDGGSSDEEILEGLLRIADERMADAIRHISVRKGIDPAGYSLVAFGGAGGQHACRVAELLEIDEVLLPDDAGLLSAVGLGHAAVERFAHREVLRVLAGCADHLDSWFCELEAKAERELMDEGVPRDELSGSRRIVELRFVGQDSSLELEPTDMGRLAAQFEEAYARLFGYRPEARDIEVVALRVVVRSRSRQVLQSPPAVEREESAVAGGSQRSFMAGSWRQVPTFETSQLASGVRIDGPALLQQDFSALVVPQRWRAEMVAGAGIRVRRGNGTDHPTGRHRRRLPAVELELMSHRFASIAREMGELLQRTAISTNIKEREDFSCTLLDPRGRLVVNAPHIPVHLGAMGLCVRELVAHRALRSGDVVVTNHPAFGGSHLPDVTMVAPVDRGKCRVGYVACRAHHAEIGGVRPGSVPPNATTLAEEGVVIPPVLLLDGGRARWERLEAMLSGGRYPTRSLADNLADLRAMLAAITRGREALVALADAVGTDHVAEHMDALRRLASEQVAAVLVRLGGGVYRGRQLLDDGSPLAAALTVHGGRGVLDFAGTAGVHAGNLNATPAIVHSVTMYVLRLLVEADLPLNEGLLDPVEIRIPEGLLNPPFDTDPRRCPAVVGGNVETSQRLVDTLLEALGVVACSQGTMNNVSFGDSRFGYYETIGGGSGAVAGRDGESGVHTHMTNTRITDPEVIEHRYPVRMRRFALRRGSGGAGRWRGGDGLVRELEFLAPLELAILSQHRVTAPYGAAGGGDGAVGRQWIERADGTRDELAGIDGCRVGPGDRVVVETPGGGGYGRTE